jgi:hypothetical protein
LGNRDLLSANDTTTTDGDLSNLSLIYATPGGTLSLDTGASPNEFTIDNSAFGTTGYYWLAGDIYFNINLATLNDNPFSITITASGGLDSQVLQFAAYSTGPLSFQRTFGWEIGVGAGSSETFSLAITADPNLTGFALTETYVRLSRLN